MARIFISHSSRDNEAAQRLFRWVKEQEFDEIFLDIDKHAGIPPGARWEQELYTKLERSQAVILVLTANWMDSKWCFAEFAQARALGKAIFPIIETPEGDTFVGEDLQAINLTRDREEGLERLGRQLTELSLQSSEGFTLEPGISPFPGMAAFSEEHAAVYFGRDEAIARLIERLRKQRTLDDARLTAILGASGSGKSSLLRAGLLPRLKRDSENWMVLPPMRPEARPLQRLVDLLIAAAPEASEEEHAEWERALEGDEPGTTLARISRRALRRHAHPDARLLISVDQAEELFTRADAVERQKFFRFLSIMLTDADLPFAAVLTLRSDHLDDLQQATSLPFEPFTLDPLAKESIPAIVRGPARIGHIAVDDAFVASLMDDVEGPAWLPLVAFALRELYDRFGGDGAITLEEYRTLGDATAGLNPLENAVRRAAKDALPNRHRPAGADAALREAFIPALVRVSREGDFVRQTAALDDLPDAAQPDIRRLIEARLLVSRDGQVEVAHEALFRVWPRLAAWLEEEREFLLGLDRVRDALADWEGQADSEKSKALLSGKLLERARDWLAEHPRRFTDAERDYIRQSAEAADRETRRKRRQQRWITWGSAAAALVFAVLSGLALQQWDRAREGEQAAKESLRAATDAANQIIFNLAREFEDSGVPGDVQRSILQRARALQEQLVEGASDDPALQRSVAATHTMLGKLFIEQGRLNAALDEYKKSLNIARALSARNPTNSLWRDDVAVALTAIGDARFLVGDTKGALAAYEEGLAIKRKLSAREPDNAQRRRGVMLSLRRIGHIHLKAGNAESALEAYEEALEIIRKLTSDDPNNKQWRRDLALTTSSIGDVRFQAGNIDGALEAYEEALEIIRKLSAHAPNNTQWQRDLVERFNEIGNVRLQLGDAKKAQEAYQEGLDVARALTSQDPDNTTWRSDVAVSLSKLGDLRLQMGDAKGALKAYEEGLEILRTLSAQDPDNARVRRNLAVNLDKFGDANMRMGNIKSARAAYDEALEIITVLLRRDPENAQWRRDAAVGLWNLATLPNHPVDWSDAVKALEQLKADGIMLPKDDKSLKQARAYAAKSEAVAQANTSFRLLFEKEFAMAEDKARSALEAAPELQWIKTNLAHALMFQDKTDEADEIYLGMRGETVQGQPWEAVVRSDFAALRSKGLNHPHMSDVEAAFGEKK